VPLQTTMGQLLVNEALPPQYQDHNRQLIGGALDDLLGQIGRENPELYRDISHKLMELGRHTAYEQGTTISLSDLQAPSELRKEVFAHVDKQEAVIDKSNLSPAEKAQARAEVYGQAQKLLTDETYAHAQKSGNPLALQVLSKARGNPTQLAAMLSTPGTFQDTKGNTIPIFVRRSYAEGLTPAEYYAATFGARRGVVSTKFCLAEGSEVLMADYSVKCIEDVNAGDTVFTVDDNMKMVPTKVVETFNNGLRECWDFKFRQGRSRSEFVSIRATEDHKAVMSRKKGKNRVSEKEPLSKAHRGRRAIHLAAGEHSTTGNRFHSKTYLGAVHTYDLEVAHESHNFVLANMAVVSNSTRDAGDFGKQLNVAAADLIVTEADCGTVNGIPVGIDDNDTVGAILARGSGGFKLGAPVGPKMLKSLKQNKVDKILVRSPITCQAQGGVCKHCVGLRENGKFPELRSAVGIQASSALAERIAQGSLNVKHSGGQSAKGEATYAGFNIINQIGQIPSAFRHKAILSEQDGLVTKIEPAPQGGTNVYIGEELHYVEPEQAVTVKEGDDLEAGDQLATGIVNPAEVVRHKGIGEGRRYFAERLTQAFKDSKLKANRRNTELIARAVIDHVDVEEPSGLGNFLPGDVASYNNLAYSYKPRADAGAFRPTKAVGQYLEQPALHYTIGTRVTKKIAKELEGFGVNTVTAHSQQPGFTPRMIRLRAVPHYGKDWMAKLHGSYLQTNLLKDVQEGSQSNIHGTHPVPGIAYGAEFGESKKNKVTF